MDYKIAVIGSGISGLGASWALAKSNFITLFEKDRRLGGHANTVVIDVDGGTPIDTCFIVYNSANYPFLTALFKHLDVDTLKSNMSFSISLDSKQFEYSSDLKNLIFDWSKFRNPRFRQLFKGLVKFYGTSLDCFENIDKFSIYEYLKMRRFDDQFIFDHIAPMCSAIWSCSSDSIINSPASTFVSFFSNHQLAKLFGRPKWRTVRGGSQKYIEKLIIDSDRLVVKTSTIIASVDREDNRITINYNDGSRETFDKLIFATHFDETLRLLNQPSSQEREILASFEYSKNRAVLHEDDREMPLDRNIWASWNFVQNQTGDHRNLTVSYWMNKLQRLSTKQQFFVTLNPANDIQKVYYETEYTHPIFTRGNNKMKLKSINIQGFKNTWFCSACLGDGFHEDGLQAGLWVAQQICKKAPKLTDKKYTRLPLTYQNNQS